MPGAPFVANMVPSGFKQEKYRPLYVLFTCGFQLILALTLTETQGIVSENAFPGEFTCFNKIDSQSQRSGCFVRGGLWTAPKGNREPAEIGKVGGGPRNARKFPPRNAGKNIPAIFFWRIKIKYMA